MLGLRRASTFARRSIMSSPITEAVSATPDAIETIRRLEATYGPLALFQSGGCCEGTAPMCFRDGELPPGPNDLRLGEVAGAPFYINRDQYARWGQPQFVVDVAPGAAEGFSLEGLEGVHFVTRTR